MSTEPFTMLALVEAGHIKADDDIIALMQNVSRAHAHTIAKWLALATNTPVRLQFTTIGTVEYIAYTPEEVRAGIQRIGGDT